MKNTQRELENDIPENCTGSLYKQRHTHCQSLYTHSNQKSHQECSKQLINNWLPFLPSQQVLGMHETILVENVPCSEKKVNSQ